MTYISLPADGDSITYQPDQPHGTARRGHPVYLALETGVARNQDLRDRARRLAEASGKPYLTALIDLMDAEYPDSEANLRRRSRLTRRSAY